jgi:hypothetical protein
MPETITPNSELPHVLFKLGDELDRALISATLVERAEEKRPYKSPRKRSWRPFVATFAGVAAAAVIAFLVIGVGKGDHQAGVQEALADIAHKVDIAPRPGPNQFQYMKTRTDGRNWVDGGLDQLGNPYKKFYYSAPNYDEWYISASHDGVGRMRTGAPTFPTPQDAKYGKQYLNSFDARAKLYKTAAGRAQLRKINRKTMAYNRKHNITGTSIVDESAWEPATWSADGNYYFGGESLSRKQLAAYPRDPQAMYNRMKRSAERENRRAAKAMKNLPPEVRVAPEDLPSAKQLLWTALTDTGSAGQPLPADLRSARLRALALLPGVRADGSGTDAFGRKGTRIVWDDQGVRNEQLYDEENASLLMTRAVLLDPKKMLDAHDRALPAGTVMRTFQLIEQRTVNHAPPLSAMKN